MKRFTIITILLPSSSSLVTAYGLTQCRDTIQELIAQNQTILNDTTLVWPTIDRTKLEITFDFCERTCGDGFRDIYSDCGPRLFSWVLPIIILAVSVQLPPLAWHQQLWATFRYLGDPIGTLVSMVNELRFYERCLEKGNLLATARHIALTVVQNQEALPVVQTHEVLKHGQPSILVTPVGTVDKYPTIANDFARILHAFSKSGSGLSVDETTRYLTQAISHMAPPGQPSTVLENFQHQVTRTGDRLVHLKSRSIIRSFFAIFCFIAGLVIAIVPEVAGSGASGGMIASILTLSPLLLKILLSNSIGEYTHLQPLCDELDDFISAATPKETREHLERIGVKKLAPSYRNYNTDLLTYVNNSTRSCTPPHGNHSKGSWIRRHALTACSLVTFPVGIGAAGGAIGAAPGYFQDRHFVLIAIFFAWPASWWTTNFAIGLYGAASYLHTIEKEGKMKALSHDRKRRMAWWLVAIKDTIIAIAVPVFLAGMTCGWLGGCKMWAGYYWYGGRQKARMLLTLGDVFDRNSKVIFPILVSVCLGLSMFAFCLLRWKFFRPVFRVIAGDDHKMGQSEQDVELTEVNTV
ncbi:hypothetical protein B0H66DRAFT_73359 [Apodospora peruviana]|uniref:Uncharacterized protein n=1 Tax=Apodospora peruviana TaxID=516989 RepID=A0AAE0MFW6_9PEZI|nr:hypothetical protein B0H66DRAFT_73359 [Apodospora peruviana]